MSPIASIRGLLSSPIASASGADGTSAGGVLLFPAAGSGLLSTVSSRFLSLVTWGDPLSAISGRLLPLIASGDPLSTVSGYLLSSITGVDPLSTIFGHLLSLVIDSSLLSTVSGGSPLSLIPPAGSWALF